MMERVATLIRANLNDLVDKAEDPEKMLKQVMLDMQNQLMQVKTQVAIAIADQHLLAKKGQEHADKAAEWERKAQLAVDKREDDLARAAIERSLTCRTAAENFQQQVEDQTAQVENLKSALRKLQDKLAEAQTKTELLAAQHRRARVMKKAAESRLALTDGSAELTAERLKNKVAYIEAVGEAKTELAGDSLEDRLAALDKSEKVEKLLEGLKARKGLLSA